MSVADPSALHWIAMEEDPTFRLRGEIADLFAVEDVRLPRSRFAADIEFIGRLLRDSASAFPLLQERFARLGYTAMLRRMGNRDVLLAVKGLTPARPSNAMINLILFLLTIGSTIYSGAFYVDMARFPIDRWLGGILFSASLLAILGAHELGHYFMGRRHKVDVTLPYFIPFPISIIGTFGAFIRMKSPVQNRRALFDVAVGGPLAGLVVALPVMIIGLALSAPVPWQDAPTRSLLLSALVQLVQPEATAFGIRMHPIAWAGYIGLFVTGLNLLPAGQLDGGHTAYAIFGRFSRYIAMLTVAVLLGIAFYFQQTSWFIWIAFILFTGLGHPEPLDDVTPLDPKRRLLGLLTLGLLFVLVSPRPF